MLGGLSAFRAPVLTGEDPLVRARGKHRAQGGATLALDGESSQERLGISAPHAPVFTEQRRAQDGVTVSRPPPGPTEAPGGAAESADGVVKRRRVTAPAPARLNDIELVRGRLTGSIVDVGGRAWESAPWISRVPGHELSPIESAGLTQWTRLDTPGAAIVDLRRRAAADVARAQGASKPYRPHTNAPEYFGWGTAARCAHTPLLSELREGTPPSDGGVNELAAVDRAALVRLHSDHCDTCKGGEGSIDCYGIVMIHMVTNFDITLAWIKDPPPVKPLYPPPARPASQMTLAERKLDGLVADLVENGTAVERPHGELGMESRVFAAPVYDVKLPDDVWAAIEGATPARASELVFRAARGVADAILGSLRLGAGIAAGASSPTPATLSAAWESALEGVMSIRKIRLVHSLVELNEYVHPWRYSMMSIWDLLRDASPGDYYAKLDVKSGFYRIFISESSRRYFSFFWRGKLYVFRRLPMGLLVSPALFSWLTAELNRILRRRGVKCSICYIDDFIIRAASKSEAQAGLDLLKAVCTAIGLPFAVEKTSVEATQDIVALGFGVLTDGRIVIPAARLVKTYAYAMVVVDCAAANIPVPRYLLASLGGLVNWLTQVNPVLVPFTHRVAELAFGGRVNQLAHAKVDTVEGLRMLLSRAKQGRVSGVALLPARTGPHAVLWSTSDATSGAGDAAPAVSFSLTGDAYVRVNLPGLRGVDIVLIELLATVLLLARYGPLLRGRVLIHGCDNTATTFWINGQRSARTKGLTLLRIIALQCEHFEISLLARWLPRWINHANDRIAAAACAADLASASARFAPLHGVTCFTSAGSLGDVAERALLELNLPNLPDGFSPRAEMAREESS